MFAALEAPQNTASFYTRNMEVHGACPILLSTLPKSDWPG